MTNEKPKTKAGKFLRFAGQLLKGQIKSIPWVGNLIVDGVEMATKKDIITGVSKDHNKTVYIAELLGFIVIISFLVHKGILTSDVLMKVIEAVINAIV